MKKIGIDDAIAHFQNGEVSLGAAARMAGITKEQMMEECGRRGIPVVNYDADDLDDELRALRGGMENEKADPIDAAMDKLGRDMIEFGKRMDSDPEFRARMKKRTF